MDGLKRIVSSDGPEEWREYYSERNIAGLFQGLTAALVYHRPENPVDFLLEQISQLLRLGSPPSGVSWVTFLPPGDSSSELTSARDRRAVSSLNITAPVSAINAGDQKKAELSAPDAARLQAQKIRQEEKSGEGESSTTTTTANTSGIQDKSTQGAAMQTTFKALEGNTAGLDPEGEEELQDDDDDEGYISTLPSKETQSKAFWEVMEGSFSNLPSMPQKIVRIFLSSTFSDFKAERNILSQFAYPRLEEICATKGIDFQVVDMRWGVPDELVNDHQVSTLCISEIKTCQELSCGPNFVVLLGDRYGWQGFPARIQCEEFSALMSEIRNETDAKLLEDWFRRDDNAVPSEYVLQPIQAHFKYYDDAKDTERRTQDRTAWNNVSTRLQNILRASVVAGREKGTITEEQKQKYFSSVTEEEIVQGVLGSGDPTNEVICYHRSLQGLTEASETTYRGKFIDLTKEHEIDVDAQSMRIELLQGKLRPVLSSDKIKEYTVNWKDVPLQRSSEPEHQQYLKQFCEDFIDDIKNIVTKKVNAEDHRSSQRSKWTTLYHEVLHHACFGWMKCEVFCGRQDEVQRIRDYLKDGEQGGHQPFILHGISGMGKTALMAYVASKLKEWFGPKCFGVYRFLGTSPLSSNISETLVSVIDQISLLYRLRGLNESDTDMFGKVRRAFHALLEKISMKESGPLVIMLDSIDQLSTTNGAHRMVWLPKSLPRNVYLIVSMLTTDKNNTLSNTRNRVKDQAYYHELSPLSETTGDQIIDSHLARNQRRLTDQQRQYVVNAFKSLRHPLYLKLIIDKAKTWASYLPVSAMNTLIPEDGAGHSVKAAIHSLFESMEIKHGATFVRHALGYLTCGNGGLTEIEMEDALSCDDHVLNEVYRYHEPPLEGVIRIPSLLWSRLQHALKEYICERRVDGKVVLAWYHRQFWEAAETRYLQPESEKRRIHGSLSELFLQETGIKRTITLQYFNGKIIENADRRVKPQLLEATNLRKLQAAPYHLYQSENHELLVSRCLINFEWLYLKLQAFHINTVIRDFELMNVHPDVTFFRKFLEMSFDALSRDANLLAYNVVERLQSCSEGNPHLEAIVADARKWLATTDTPLLVPTIDSLLQSANSPQLFGIQLGYDALLNKDQSRIVCIWSERISGISKIQTLDLNTRDIVGSVSLVKPAPFKILSDNHHFVFAEDQHIKVYEMDTGDMVSNIAMFPEEYEKVTARCIAVSNNGKFIATAIRLGKPKNHSTDAQWRTEVRIFLIDTEEERVVSSTLFRGKNQIDNMFFIQNDDMLMGTSRNKVHTYSVPGLRDLKTFSSSHSLHANTLQIFPDANVMIGACSLRSVVRVHLFDYEKMDMKLSENVHIEAEQKGAHPFAIHVESPKSRVLVGSYGDTDQEPISSICVWNQGISEDSYTKIELKKQGYKTPCSLSATQDWQYALVGWLSGNISVVDIDKKEELMNVTAHGHAIYFMMLLNDGKTLVTTSQDHMLKMWDLQCLLQQAAVVKDVVKEESTPLSEMSLHQKYECLHLIASDEFMVSAPKNNLWAPRFWRYDGHIVSKLSEVYQELYSNSVEMNGIKFPVRQHGELTELEDQVLVYERKRRNCLTVFISQGFREQPKILGHQVFENTYFKLVIPMSRWSKKSLLYAVHDGTLGVYDILTLEPLKKIGIPPITKDIPNVDSNSGKKRLLYYQVGVTIDERYFLIASPGGGIEGKYMDIIKVEESKYKKRISLPKYTPFRFLADGVYFVCEDRNEEIRCYPAGICYNIIKERGRDFDYRSLVLTERLLSKDKSVGCCIDNKAHAVNVWQLEPLEMLHSLRGHETEVTSIDISTDNQFMVSGSFDNTVRVWSLEKGTQLCMFHMFGAVSGVHFSPAMSHVAVECYSSPQRKRAVPLELRNISLPTYT